MSDFTKKEKKFADELANYEDKWVAIKRDGDNNTIVASGNRIGDAKRAAESKGIKNPVFRKVPSSKKVFIA